MPYEVVSKFEKTVADYAGAKYGVSVSSCTNAIFLSLLYTKSYHASIPKFTYPGVACSILNAGCSIDFKDLKWQGIYCLDNTSCNDMSFDNKIIDSALRFKRGMYIKDSFYCISFHIKKHIPIGRGGMILTDSEDAYDWLKKARFDGRSECPLNKDKLTILGWNMYMTPEQAARGLSLFDLVKEKNLEDLKFEDQNYPDLSKIGVYKCKNKSL
jgi:dTDP-4-amino-4,6-dideoxygalactose transaminase